MELRKLKAIGFVGATLDAVVAACNKYTSGQAVSAVDTGTRAYPAGDAANHELIGQYFEAPDATHFAIVLFYVN